MDSITAETHIYATELVAALHEDLRLLQQPDASGPVRRELLARIFRHTHSFKGIAQTAGLNAAAQLAHEMEAVLDALRLGQMALNGTTIATLKDSAEKIQSSLQSQNEAALVAAQQHLRQLPASAISLAPAMPAAWAEELTPHEIHRAGEALAEGLSLMALTVSIDLENLAEDLPALTAKLMSQGELLATKPLVSESASLVAFRLFYAAGLAEQEVAELVAPGGPYLLEVLAHEKTSRVAVQEVLERVASSAEAVAQAAGREITVAITGGTTLWDSALAHTLYPPLLQLARNAVAHGIETPAGRRAAGKTPTGRIQLATWLEDKEIVVCVSDDGRGLAPPATAATIFQPGFSTASEVTDWAGRGVGLDIVKHTVEGLGGRIEVASEKGDGTAFTLFIPYPAASR